jgi:hypothetical protein
MIGRRALLVLAAAVALAVPASAVAKGECAADQRVIAAWSKGFDTHVRIVDDQLVVLQQIFTLISSNQQVPHEVFVRLQTLVRQHDAVINATERRLVATKAGTAKGRTFKRLALRYFREVARPLNRCLAQLLTADTTVKLAAVGTCVQKSEGARNELSRALTRALARMRAAKDPCTKQ